MSKPASTRRPNAAAPADPELEFAFAALESGHVSRCCHRIDAYLAQASGANDAALRHNRAAARLLRAGRHALALHYIERGLACGAQSYQRREELYALQCHAFLVLDRTPELMAACRAALEINPFNGEVRRTLGLAQQVAGLYADAARSYMSAIRTRFGDETALKLLERLASQHRQPLLAAMPDLDLLLARFRRIVEASREPAGILERQVSATAGL